MNMFKRWYREYRIVRRMQRLDSGMFGPGLIVSCGGILTQSMQRRVDRNNRMWIRLSYARHLGPMLNGKRTFNPSRGWFLNWFL